MGQNLHTLIKNAQLLWCDEPGLPCGRDDGALIQRWLTPRELLLVQCFPVAKCDSSDHLCSFNLERPGGRKRSAIIQQAGNSMTVPAIGAMQVFAGLSCIVKPSGKCQQSDLLSNLLRRKAKRAVF